MLKLKFQYFGHLMRGTDSLEKTLMMGNDWRQKQKGMTEGEMVVWHHWFHGHESKPAPGFDDGQGSLACYSPWFAESETERPNRLTSLRRWGWEFRGEPGEGSFTEASEQVPRVQASLTVSILLPQIWKSGPGDEQSDGPCPGCEPYGSGTGGRRSPQLRWGAFLPGPPQQQVSGAWGWKSFWVPGQFFLSFFSPVIQL